MKKSLLALAVLGAFAGTASAQSNVTLYGRVDLSVARNIGTDYWQMQNGSGSRLGVRGAEDLGGGLKAIFNIEHRFNADTGELTTAKFWHGRSYVGLAGGFGEVRFGRDYTPSFLFVELAADPWGFDTVATPGTGLRGSIEPVRKDNSINYSSPNWGGFRIHGQWSMDEVPGNDTNGTWGFAATYAAGPLSFGLGYDKSADEDGTWLIGTAAYDFGMFKLIGALGQGRTAGAAGVDGDKMRDYHIAATAPIGAGELRGSYNRLTNRDADVKVMNKFSVGYHYPMSKRTTVYTDLARDSADHIDDNKWGFDVGIKHNF
ncbi:porin [Schlegelella sp. S2-27]|uniref:Porin n=1 Tax=Caldimonas mangrovi TaxID=2944811 RepID=A0ABT0YUS3_9BURK|nr:porin [Caldimonas mangrovi]MCM5682054.1 porin [Caldimonas mangrovi]